MEGLIVPLLLTFLVFVFVLPPLALARATRAEREVKKLKERLRGLEKEATFVPPKSAAEDSAPSPAMAPPLSLASEQKSTEAKIEAPGPATRTVPAPSTAAARPPRPPIDWEQFMGAKMFAWIGGLALFLGIAFFVKYSFEHNLIPPELRVAIGFFAGVVLVTGGTALKRRENIITAQTLCATGILILYAVTFACRSFYHFPFFGLLPTFALMILITAAAFALAVRMDALVVAILGIAGGFVTPILLSTGQDNAVGLFGYVALLDAGLLLVARRKQWLSLPILGAIGTTLMQVAWVGEFFVRNQYYDGGKTLLPMGIFLGLQVFFTIAALLHKGSVKFDRALAGSALALAAVALGWAIYFLSFSRVAERPVPLFSYLFAVDAAILALLFAKPYLARLLSAAGGVVFAFLAWWTQSHLTLHNLHVALAAYLLFALLHSCAPLVQGAAKSAPSWSSHLFPGATLLLVLLPIFKLATASFLVWPLVWCVDVLALFTALVTGTIGALALVFVLTLVALGAWLIQLPTITLAGAGSALFLIGGFAVFFVAATSWAARRLGPAVGFMEETKLRVQLPAFSAALPFALLILASLRLPMANPTPVFALGLLLVVLLLGLAKIFAVDLLACVALGATVLLEFAWHAAHFDRPHAITPLAWYLTFAVIFTAFPFLFHRQFADRTLVWASSALAMPLQFLFVYHLARTTHPAGMLGLLPAAFALPALLCLFLILRFTPRANSARTAQLALFGAAALLFVTLIFPIQFDREWVTLGWALEGVALCWLFRRVPHPGLRLAGVALIAIAFIRLTFNPAVLTYHGRAATPLLNWYLYTYGIVALCAFTGARLLAPPRHLLLRMSAPPLLYALGTLLVFLLLNIEIADYFSKPGTAALTFQFSGNFARDMSYSIAWAVFALTLLIVGIRQRAVAVRWAGLSLLAVVILKLFLHDLSRLDQLYRIAAFIVVALVAIIASFLYQRFLGANEPQPSI